MKTILVPTDFSENALNAILYALKMNKKIKAKIILFHSYIIPVYATDIPLPEVDEEEFRNGSLKELRKLKTRFQSESPGIVFEVELSTTQGFAGEEIVKIAGEKKADLVVMGTKGATGLREALVGSFTADVIETINCPVLAVPEKAKFDDLKKIVFATNYALNDFENIKKAIDFAKHFNADIILLHVATGDLDRTFEFNSIERFKEQIKQESKYDKVTFKLLENTNVLEAMNLYLDEVKADMVAMTTRHRSFFQKLFNRSMAKRMSYHSHIPVIVFH